MGWVKIHIKIEYILYSVLIKAYKIYCFQKGQKISLSFLEYILHNIKKLCIIWGNNRNFAMVSSLMPKRAPLSWLWIKHLTVKMEKACQYFLNQLHEQKLQKFALWNCYLLPLLRVPQFFKVCLCTSKEFKAGFLKSSSFALHLSNFKSFPLSICMMK